MMRLEEDYFFGYVLGDPEDVKVFYTELLRRIQKVTADRDMYMADYSARGNRQAGQRCDECNAELAKLKKLEGKVKIYL